MNTSFTMLCICAMILMAVGFLFARPILILFGASAEAIIYAYPCMMLYLIGTLPSMIAVGMNPFINAQGYSSIGMLSVAIGAGTNLVLDPCLLYTSSLTFKICTHHVIFLRQFHKLSIIHDFDFQCSLIKRKITAHLIMEYQLIRLLFYNIWSVIIWSVVIWSTSFYLR